ncbi:hypothetical protein VP01_1022g3 [Puccinia sorghi]|uniref:Uncharacterized protein n=1 Tax=Puccinia sorghi TaxID=27349 RepID=A0A0L6VV43_9BASI|nr:hypothetical protein VP01_1022g3 [Puccinia sorghi]
MLTRFDVKTCQVFLFLVSQAPFFPGIAQLLFGPIISPPQQLLAEFNSVQLTYFTSKHSKIKCYSFLYFSLPCLYYGSHLIRSLLSEVYLFGPPVQPLKIMNICSLLIFPCLPRPSASCSILTRWTSFLISVSTALVYTLNANVLSPQGGTITKCTQCNLKHPSQTHLRPQTKIPITSPLMPTQTSQITNIPIQPSSPRILASPGIDQPPLSKFEWHSYFQQAPGKMGLESGVYKYMLLHNIPVTWHDLTWNLAWCYGTHIFLGNISLALDKLRCSSKVPRARLYSASFWWHSLRMNKETCTHSAFECAKERRGVKTSSEERNPTTKWGLCMAEER